MISKLFVQKLAYSAIYITIFIVLVLLFLLQQSNVNKRIRFLENQNVEFIKKDSLHIADIAKIVKCNPLTDSFLKGIHIGSNKIYLHVDYPVCNSCLINVCHYLNAFAKKNEQALIVLCKSQYVRTVKMSLKFENLEEIEIDPLISAEELPAKMTVVFNSADNQSFCLPLPEKRELNFLETFLSVSN